MVPPTRLHPKSIGCATSSQTLPTVASPSRRTPAAAAQETQPINCSISVMAGLVPAIHVVVQLYITKLSVEVQMLQKALENLYGYLGLTTWMAGTSPAMTAPIDSVI
jgi:hypothetical protein